MASSRDPFARLARRLLGISRPVMLLAGIWTLGLIALSAVIVFETRVDQTRRAQVVIAQMRNEQSSLISIAFSPATAQAGNLPAPTQTARQLTQAEGAYRGRPEDVDRNAGIAGMLRSGMSWTKIQAATGCSRATIAKIARRAA